MLFLPQKGAVERNDVSELRDLLSCEKKNQSKELTIALERAILKKSDDSSACVELLLQHGANPNGMDGSGIPYLVTAIDAGCHRVAHLLLQNGSDVNSTRIKDGATALHRAVLNNDIEGVQLLLNCDADVNRKDESNKTALLYCCVNSFSAGASLILRSRDAHETDVTDETGSTCLLWCLSHRNMDLACRLLSLRANINVTNNKGRNAFLNASESGMLEIVQEILRMGTDIQHTDSENNSGLLLAAKNKHIQTVLFLIDKGASLNTADTENRTALLYLTEYPDVVKLLLQEGACPNILTNQGDTPLLVATVMGHVASTCDLLQNGADPVVTSEIFYLTLPLQAALYNADFSITQMLFTASVELGSDLSWLDDFLMNPQFQNRVLTDEKTRRVYEWIKEEMTAVEFVFPSLQNLCRWVIRDQIGDVCMERKIKRLPLPTSLKEFLHLKSLQQYCS